MSDVSAQLTSALSYLGRDSQAFDVLERIFAHSTITGFQAEMLNPDPWLQRLRGEPRFQALLRKVNLGP